MSQTDGDFIVERIHAWGVWKVCSYPGDGINGVFGTLNRARDKIAFVQARCNKMAAFMASASPNFRASALFALLGADRQGRVDLYRVDRL